MNIFVPQSIQTQIELEELADVKLQMVVPKSSRTIIGIIQDGLIGAYNITHDDMRIPWRNTMNILSATNFSEFNKIKKDKIYTGKEVYSFIIPDNINIDKADITIKNGQIVNGRLSKASLGAGGKNTILQNILDEYGAEIAKNFVDNTLRLINNFNLFNGFTVGIGDLEISKQIQEDIDKIFNKVELSLNHKITNAENNPHFMTTGMFEEQIFSELNIVRENVSKLIVSNIDQYNKFKIMESSGSKGNPTNIGQMAGCIGLQTLNGTIIKKRYNDRTLAYFYQNDDRSQARGLIKNSFLVGESFSDFVFNMSVGREGIIDQVVKTADIGYIHRKLIKMLENVMVKYDGTIRSATNGLLQFSYGDCGSDTTRQYEYKIKLLEMNNTELENKFKFNESDLKHINFTQKENNEMYNNIKYMRDHARKQMLKATLDTIAFTNSFMIPVNLNTIMGNAKEIKFGNTKLSPKYILEKIEELLANNNSPIIFVAKSKLDKSKFKIKDDLSLKYIYKIALFDAIAPKICINEYKFTKEMFDVVFTKITTAFIKGMVEPGEMIGIIAAQSIGEPITQLTINAFHNVGIADKSHTTLGVPRIKEILSVSKNLKTPQMIISIDDEFKNNKQIVQKIASQIRNITIENIRNKIDIYYESDPTGVDNLSKRDNIITTFYKVGQKTDLQQLPWIIRIEIDKEQLVENKITLLDIQTKLSNWWDKRYHDMKNLKKEYKNIITKISSFAILCNTDTDEQPVLHLRFNVKDTDKIKSPFNMKILMDFIDIIIDKFKLKGITNISDTDIKNERMISFSNNGSIDKTSQNIIYTQGVNLIDIRYINGIDIYNTITNDIAETYKIFGIEIARTVLMHEFIYSFERASISTNYQHVSLLVDLMTSEGYIMSIDRHGNNKVDPNPLSRASFEKTVENLLNAATFSETDTMKGISSRIISGLVIKGGTGYCDISLDLETIQNSEYLEEYEKKNTFEIEGTPLINDIINQDDTTDFVPF